MTLIHLDLFSGIGGFALAAKWAGFETVMFCEKDKFCQQVLMKHWPNVPIQSDIKDFHFMDKGKVDLLTGGFPCQSFSVAGKRKGKEDDRYLWPEMFRVIRRSKPNWVVAENVVGIVDLALDNILLDLESENYETQSFIIPACAANAPHRRDRVWIIANLVCKRCCTRSNSLAQGQIQINQERNLASYQTKWLNLQPDAWKAYAAKEWLSHNADYSRANDGLPNRVDRIKSLGNAIVPQVAYPILKLIAEIEKHDWKLD